MLTMVLRLKSTFFTTVASVQVVIEAQMCCPVQHETQQEAAVLCKPNPVGGVRKPAANHEVSTAPLRPRRYTRFDCVCTAGQGIGRTELLVNKSIGIYRMNKQVTLTDDDGMAVGLPVGAVEFIAASPPAEQDEGTCVIQFRLNGAATHESGPYNTLSNWHENKTLLSMEAKSAGRIKRCRLRECTPGPGAVPIQIYLPDSATRLRNRFGK